MAAVTDVELARLVGRLREEVARLIGGELADVDANTNFMDLGFDSILAVQLVRRLATTWGVARGDARCFSIRRCASWPLTWPRSVLRWLAPRWWTPRARRRRVTFDPRSATWQQWPRQSLAASAGVAAIAVVGVALRFPGAETPEAFWELLATGATRWSDRCQASDSP